MRIEIAGAQVTESVAELLETLQTDRAYLREVFDAIDSMCRKIALDTDLSDGDVVRFIRVLQLVRRDYSTLANPPEVDDPANDVPTASF